MRAGDEPADVKDGCDPSLLKSSIIGRLADLTSRSNCNEKTCPRNNVGAVQSEPDEMALRRDHQQLFRRWLLWGFERQILDVEKHLSAVGTPGRSWLQLAPYTALVPHDAHAAEVMLFSCEVEAILAIIRGRDADLCGSGDWRIRRVLEFMLGSRVERLSP